MILLPFIAKGQDIHFSQFNETPVHLNPAYAGLFDGTYRVMTNYRSQWAAMGSPFRTMAAAFDMPIGIGKNKSQLGMGLFVYRDQAGDSKFGTFQGSAALSGIVPITNLNRLSAGIQFGMGQRSATVSGLQWESQYINGNYDPTAPSNEGNMLTSFVYPDLSTGLAWNYRNKEGNLDGKDVTEINAGLSAFHINRPQMRFHGGGTERLYMRLVLHAQVRYDFPKTRWSIRPSAYYMKQGPTSEVLVGSLLRYRIRNGTKITNFYTESGIGLGLHYRLKDAIIPQLYYDLGDIFIGVSYDFNVLKYTAISRGKGGFEITLRYANLAGALYKNKK